MAGCDQGAIIRGDFVNALAWQKCLEIRPFLSMASKVDS
jgi:hypothetical protein